MKCHSVWSDFVVHDTSMTRLRYNFAGKFYEDVLDHQRASEALHELANKIKRISFLPQRNLHNICSFQEIITKFCNFYGDLTNIAAFCYVFPCDFARKHNEVDIYGTGGSILQGMKGLLMKLPGLKKVELVDLQLDIVDGKKSLALESAETRKYSGEVGGSAEEKERSGKGVQKKGSAEARERRSKGPQKRGSAS